MSVFFVALDDSGLLPVDVAFFAPPTGIVNAEQHEGLAEVSESPIEDGSTITDHIRPGNDRLTINATVTRTPHFPDILRNQGRFLPLPLTGPRPYDPLRRGPPIGTPGFVTRATMAAIHGRLMPPLVIAQTTQFPTEFDPVNETYQKLEQFRKDGVKLRILTPRKDYDSMVLLAVQLGITQGKIGTFNVVAQQIKIVTSVLVPAPVPLEPKGEPVLKKGIQPPKPEETPIDTAKRRSTMRAGFEAALPGLLPALF